jgi:hypothetical protein
MDTTIDETAEKKIRQSLETYLKERGWQPDIAWGKCHGIDIEAKRGNECWIIQVSNINPLRPLIVSAFLAVLGEILQRMDDPHCKYSIALPDLEQFRRLWSRLPHLAKSRTGITALFVSDTCSTVEEA